MLRGTARGGNLHGVACPRCGCRGNFTGHGGYRRHLVTPEGQVSVAVRRVRCASCGSTHAVLPEGVVPYRAYSEAFVVAVLAAWASGMTNSQARDAFGLPETTRRRMLRQARSRAAVLLACAPSRAALAAAVRAAGEASLPALHRDSFGTRFAENVRLNNPRGRPARPPGRST